MEQSVESNFFRAIASLLIHGPYFRFFLKKRFIRKSSKPGHGNLVLITSTVQVELSKLNFNFDDTRTNFLQVLTYYGFFKIIAMMSSDRTSTEQQSRAELIPTYN